MVKTRALIKRQSTQVLLLVAIGLLIAYLIWKSRTPSLTGFSNLETWDWTDWKGRQRQITVHRETKGT